MSQSNTPQPHRTEPKPETANALKKRIVEYVRVNGGFASRLQSTGTYRDDLKKYISSQQRAGMPDVFAVVNGFAVFIEVKAGKDKLANVQNRQLQTLSGLEPWSMLLILLMAFRSGLKLNS